MSDVVLPRIIVISIAVIAVVSLIGSILVPTESQALMPVVTMAAGGLIGYLSQSTKPKAAD